MLAAHAAGALDGDERAIVQAHVDDCEECSRDLVQWQAAGTSIALGVPERPMRADVSDRIRDRLMARARAEAPPSAVTMGSRRDPAGAHCTPRSDWVREMAGWVAAAGFASLLLTHHAFHRPLSVGWIAAAVLGLMFVATAMVALRQRERMAALESRLGGNDEADDRDHGSRRRFPDRDRASASAAQHESAGHSHGQHHPARDDGAHVE